jgi:HlyD family secretion protein
MDGTVANVLINAGEQATPGAPAVTIVNEGAFHLEVSVDEIDIDRIAVGQVVSITLDALPDAAVTGVIAEIAPTALAGGGSGVVTYLVTINIDAPGVELRPGMTANASIVVEEIADALIVPNWAIRLDRETGEAFVNRLTAGGLVEEVVIETGLRNEQFSEVLSGLNEGDTVVVTNEREGFSLFGGE